MSFTFRNFEKRHYNVFVKFTRYSALSGRMGYTKLLCTSGTPWTSINEYLSSMSNSVTTMVNMSRNNIVYAIKEEVAEWEFYYCWTSLDIIKKGTKLHLWTLIRATNSINSSSLYVYLWQSNLLITSYLIQRLWIDYEFVIYYSPNNIKRDKQNNMINKSKYF